MIKGKLLNTPMYLLPCIPTALGPMDRGPMDFIGPKL